MHRRRCSSKRSPLSIVGRSALAVRATTTSPIWLSENQKARNPQGLKSPMSWNAPTPSIPLRSRESVRSAQWGAQGLRCPAGCRPDRADGGARFRGARLRCKRQHALGGQADGFGNRRHRPLVMTPRVGPIGAIAPMQNAVLREPETSSFGEALGNALDSLSGALNKADALAASAAAKKADIADATVARAKADVMLEVAAIAAAKVSGAITQLLQTQL